MKKAYYAHCIAIYNTEREALDIKTIEAMGFECVNPNNSQVQQDVAALKAAGDPNYMDYFKRFAFQCDLIIFRAIPDGRIPAGIGKEIAWFAQMDKPVIELPSRPVGRMMTVEATREYLKAFRK